MNSSQYKISYSKVASQDNMWKKAYRTWEERRSSKSFVTADRSRLIMGKLMVGLVTWHKNSERELWLAYYHWYSSVNSNRIARRKDKILIVSFISNEVNVPQLMFHWIGYLQTLHWLAVLLLYGRIHVDVRWRRASLSNGRNSLCQQEYDQVLFHSWLG